MTQQTWTATFTGSLLDILADPSYLLPATFYIAGTGLFAVFYRISHFHWRANVFPTFYPLDTTALPCRQLQTYKRRGVACAVENNALRA